MQTTRWNRRLRYAALLLGTLIWSVGVANVNANAVDTDTAEVVVVVKTNPHTPPPADDAVGEVRHLAIIDPAPEREIRVTALPKTGDGTYLGGAPGSGEMLAGAAVLLSAGLAIRATTHRGRGGRSGECRT